MESLYDKFQEGDGKIIDFDAFAILVPNSWEKQYFETGPHSVGKIKTSHNNTVEFCLGPNCRNITDYQELSVTEVTITEVVDEEGEMPSQNSTTTSTKVTQFVKSEIHFEVIDGRNAKILVPQRSGLGATGVFIDNLGLEGTGMNKFNFIGFNLKAPDERAFLHALKTIKFR
jgi:hypothetical protein